MTTSQNANTTPVEQLRTHLMETLAALRDRDNPMEVDRARAVAQVATVLVESAKTEVEFLRVTRQDQSTFFGSPALPAPAAGGEGGEPGTPGAPLEYTHGDVTQLPGRTIHRLRG